MSITTKCFVLFVELLNDEMIIVGQKFVYFSESSSKMSKRNVALE